MRLPDIQGDISEKFEGGVLPTMVYINKQESGRNKIERPLHGHGSVCELVLVYKGSGSYQINSKVYPLEEGCVAYYNQGDLHEVSSSMSTEIGDYCLGITNLRIKGLPRNHFVKKGEAYVRQAGGLFPFLKELCEQIFLMEGTEQAGKLASQLLCASLLVMVGQLEEFPQAVSLGAEDDQFVSRIWNYLNDHFTEEISLERIAKSMGCSDSYVSHIFKKAVGITPIQYVIRRRIGLAQTLLISTDSSATQIATMVGYDNTNYFSTLFSKIVGVSPIRYRQHYLEELRGMRHQS